MLRWVWIAPDRSGAFFALVFAVGVCFSILGLAGTWAAWVARRDKVKNNVRIDKTSRPAASTILRFLEKVTISVSRNILRRFFQPGKSTKPLYIACMD